VLLLRLLLSLVTLTSTSQCLVHCLKGSKAGPTVLVDLGRLNFSSKTAPATPPRGTTLCAGPVVPLPLLLFAACAASATAAVCWLQLVSILLRLLLLQEKVMLLQLLQLEPAGLLLFLMTACRAGV
jgi:hypothetical protein